MKKTILFLLLLTLVSCWQQKCDCTNFKTGKFVSEVEINGKMVQYNFERTKDLQIESFNGVIDSSTVRWVNDCEFVTRKIHPKNMQEEKSFSVKILTTNGKTYSAEFSEVGKSIKKTAAVTKID